MYNYGSNTSQAGAMAYQYDTNKILLCTRGGMWDCTLSGSGTSTSVSKTAVTIHGNTNYNQTVGSAMVLLNGHKFLFTAKNATTVALYDLTTNTQINSWTTHTYYTSGNQNYCPWLTVNAVKGTNKVDFFVDWRNVGCAQYTLTATEICEAPTFSVSGGGTSNPVVTITSATSGATIYYRIGTSGSYSTLSNGGSITVSNIGTSTIQAYAAKSGCVNSSTTSTTVSYNPKLATPTFTDTNNNALSDGQIFVSSSTQTIRIHYPSGSTLHYSLNGGSESTHSGATYVDLSMSRSGSLSNVYATQTNYTNSATTALTWYIKNLTPSPNYADGTTFNYGTNTVRLTASRGTIYYTYNGSTISGASPLDVSITQNTSLTDVYNKSTSSDYLDSDKISLTYYVRSADVTYSPSSATSFSGSTNITLTSASGGTIYYTTNGTTPTTSSSSVASGGTVTISSTCQIKAFAVSTNYVAGNVTTSPTYTSKCATPVITPATGTYSKAQTVNITSTTPGATIHYTTDGTTPTASSPVFSSPITVNDGTSTNQYIPLYGYWADAFEKTEHIIPASTLSGMGASASNAVTLNSLTWYLSTPATDSFGAARFKVFLKEVSGTTLGGAFIGPDGGTVVYEGELDATQSTLTVSFATPFEYHGGNLLVGVYTTTKGTYKQAYFYGTTGESDCSGCAYDRSSLDNITTPNSNTFLPKTTFSYSPSPLVVSKTTTVKAIAIKSGCANSDVASETITITPQSQPVAASSINVTYSPVIGTSTNNPDRDLARIDATITFNRPNTSDGSTFPAYPTTFSDYYLDHYIVTVFSGSGYAKTESGANFLNVNIDAKTGAGAANTVSLKACDLKVGQQTEVYVTAHYVYQPTSATSQSSQTSKSVSAYTYTTYAPSITATTYAEPHQAHDIWWGSQQSGEKHTCYFDVYRVEITIDDNPFYNPSTSIPVSYYQLKVSKNNGSTWENVTDRTVDMVAYGDDSNTYPIGQGIGAGRFKGNYRFSSNKIASPSGSGQISLWYYYAYDVTSAYSPTSVTDPSQGNPAAWLYRIEAVYGSSESVNVSGTAVTPTNVNITSSEYADYMPSDTNPVITGVDNVGNDIDGVKEVQYYDLKGVRLLEAPATGIYIEVRLMNNGQVVTSKRLAR
ncbi:MAG: chitobiase/beta-hexosaminidase C-terminal domain-containing protein [Muribaculaceae bacterium]|nr:chitobiase/beta-hexosaminidase C-terminal domain-containing protein [Muribaculaceae bacterium]